jgi:hypothetical protein
MAFIFYLIGWIVIIVGAVITGSSIVGQMGTINTLAADTSHFDMASVTPIVAILTGGVSVMFAGLLILAVGGVLGRLDRIARNTRLPRP